MESTKPKRPILRYHGGKFGSGGRVADWIASELPPHRMYVEPCGGAGSVLMRKARAKSEVYSEPDGDVVNLFRVVRTPYLAAELERVLRLTPYARSEFEAARETATDPVERARRLLVLAFMGHGSAGLRSESRPGFRAAESEGRILASQDWANYPDHIGAITDRLRGVLIESRRWQDVVPRYDAPSTLVYVDPPYLHDVRTARATDGYRFEMTDADHAELAAWATASPSMVVVSHYDHPLYREAYAGWETVSMGVRVDSGQSRTEILWKNPAASEACAHAARAAEHQAELFCPLAIEAKPIEVLS